MMNLDGKFPRTVYDNAYAKLSDWDRMILEWQAQRLTPIRNVGPVVAREILACIGALMERTNGR